MAVPFHLHLSKLYLINFEHIQLSWLFLSVPLLILLFFFYLQWKKRVRKRMGDEDLVNRLISSSSRLLPGIKFSLLIIAVLCGVIAVMNPRKPGESMTTRKGIDLAIALDISKSMLATDMAPNRLERAKQFITKLMNSMPDDRIALILFAGKAYLQMPLTVDHGAADLYVNTAGPEIIAEQGTVISDALEKSAYSLNTTDAKFKTVVLITDGEDHDDGALTMAKKLSSMGVMINTVGIGSSEGSTITDPETGTIKKDEAGNTVISRLNENILMEIASATNGVYTRLESSDAAVSSITEQLSQIERKAHTDFSQVNFRTFYWWAAAAMFILLVLEILIPETKNNKLKRNLVI